MRTVPNANPRWHSYHANMPKKAPRGKPSPATPDWFLKEWMSSLDVSQADLARDCDWTNSTMHGIYHGRTQYYREIVNLIAEKLNVHPYELLMHPDQARALQRQREDSLKIVEDTMPFRTGTND